MLLHSDSILQIRHLTKSFGGIKALDDVQFDLRKGEVHALMGENGAGKSTLMKILIGLLKPDAGTIMFEGRLLENSDVNESIQKGISMIHQEMQVIPELTVAQNIFLGRESTRWLPHWLDDEAINTQAQTLLSEMGINIAATTKMKQLSVAQMQMVEIAKAISNNAKVIIMDEPTSAISDKEVAMLFQMIKELKAKGVAIIYISHKMEEIYTIADTITVLRDGRYITTKPSIELDKKSLIGLMVGRELTDLFPPQIATKGNILLSVKKLSSKGRFSDISFEVKAGEVLGIAGLMGAGRTEIARAIYGLDSYEAGEVWVKGKKVVIQSPQDALNNGIGYVSEDRKGLGFIPNMSVKHNISLSNLAQYAKNGFVQTQKEQLTITQTVEELKIKIATLDQKVTQLSGGNQQKVVIGKVLLTNPDIILLDEPTRGIDIGAKLEIYKLIHELAAQGKAILLISSELPEILGMSDRVLVLSKGKQTALLSKKEATQENIMRYAIH
ncbi:MAG: sugar ABC transporter ATP-binding protein [Spirosomataceae bacterium]